MKKFLILMCAFFLFGCNKNDEQLNTNGKIVEENGYIVFEHKIKAKEFKFNGNSLSLGYGIYSVCANNKAYLFGSQKSVMFVPVTNNSKHIDCEENYKEKNVRIHHGDWGYGVFEICVGGYQFTFHNEGSASTYIVQNFKEPGVAQYCYDENMNLKDTKSLAFIHPDLKKRIRDYESFLKNEPVQEHLVNNKEKIH